MSTPRQNEGGPLELLGPHIIRSIDRMSAKALCSHGLKIEEKKLRLTHLATGAPHQLMGIDQLNPNNKNVFFGFFTIGKI